MAFAIDEILALLRTDGVEGPCQCVGYVPARPGNFRGTAGQRPENYTAIDSSGVTIGTGIDLGAYNAEQLLSYGMPSDMVNQLRPYLGLQKAAAIAKLYKLPLIISQNAAQLFDEVVISGDFKTYIGPAFKRDAGVALDSLPAQAQAVIFSVCYQYGVAGWRKFAPVTWGYMCKQDWCKASAELIHGFSAYASRRAIEGRKLMELC